MASLTTLNTGGSSFLQPLQPICLRRANCMDAFRSRSKKSGIAEVATHVCTAVGNDSPGLSKYVMQNSTPGSSNRVRGLITIVQQYS